MAKVKTIESELKRLREDCDNAYRQLRDASEMYNMDYSYLSDVIAAEQLEKETNKALQEFKTRVSDYEQFKESNPQSDVDFWEYSDLYDERERLEQSVMGARTGARMYEEHNDGDTEQMEYVEQTVKSSEDALREHVNKMHKKGVIRDTLDDITTSSDDLQKGFGD